MLLMRSAYEAVDDLNFIPMVRTDIPLRVHLRALHEDSVAQVSCLGGDKGVLLSQDRFQASFWKLRQSEYEPYLLQRSPLRTKQVGTFLASLSLLTCLSVYRDAHGPLSLADHWALLRSAEFIVMCTSCIMMLKRMGDRQRLCAEVKPDHLAGRPH